MGVGVESQGRFCVPRSGFLTIYPPLAEQIALPSGPFSHGFEAIQFDLREWPHLRGGTYFIRPISRKRCWRNWPAVMGGHLTGRSSLTKRSITVRSQSLKGCTKKGME